MTLADSWGELLERDGDWHAAARCYLHVIEVDPLAEAFHRRLMKVHDRLGNRAEALAVYERCRQALLAFQGVCPTLVTQTLYRQLSGR